MAAMLIPDRSEAPLLLEIQAGSLDSWILFLLLLLLLPRRQIQFLCDG